MSINLHKMKAFNVEASVSHPLLASQLNNLQNQHQLMLIIPSSHSKIFEEGQCLPIQPVANPQDKRLITQLDLQNENLSLPKLLIAIGLAEERPRQYDLGSIQKNIKDQRQIKQAKRKQKIQKQLEREKQRFQTMPFETPEEYLNRIKNGTTKEKKPQSDDQQETDFSYYYNVSRIQFNHQQFRRF